MSDWQHIEINNHGTIVVLRPISDEGRQWFEDNVGEPEPGGIYTCEPRMAQRAICCRCSERPSSCMGDGNGIFRGRAITMSRQSGCNSSARKVTRGACFTINWIKVWMRFGLAPHAHEGRNAAIEVNP